MREDRHVQYEAGEAPRRVIRMFNSVITNLIGVYSESGNNGEKIVIRALIAICSSVVLNHKARHEAQGFPPLRRLIVAVVENPGFKSASTTSPPQP